MAMVDERGGAEGPGDDPKPSEFPALDEQQGYWARWWAEFKRLARKDWEEGDTRPTLILAAAIFVVGFFGVTFLDW